MLVGYEGTLASFVSKTSIENLFVVTDAFQEIEAQAILVAS